MKTLQYKYDNGIEVTLTVPDEDYEWIRLLFATNSKPFKALRDIGYDVKAEGKNQG